MSKNKTKPMRIYVESQEARIALYNLKAYLGLTFKESVETAVIEFWQRVEGKP